MNSNAVFPKTIFVQNMIIPKVLFSKSAGTKNYQFKIWHFGNFSFQIFFVQENVCFRIWFFFFGKIHFKFWFPMKKFGKKSCLLKWAQKPKSVLFSAEQTESKRFFSHMNFSTKSCFSKIEFKTWFSRN